jgi:hypothetical protein
MTPTKAGHDRLTSAVACAWFGDSGTESWFQCSPRMSLRADIYRQRAAEAKQSAARAKNPSIKCAFEEVAKGWLVLAEEMEVLDSFWVRSQE